MTSRTCIDDSASPHPLSGSRDNYRHGISGPRCPLQTVLYRYMVGVDLVGISFYDRGTTFPLINCFLMTGLPNSHPSEWQSCFENRRNCILGPWDYSSGCDLHFAVVRYQVRSLRNIMVNLYRKTPLVNFPCTREEQSKRFLVPDSTNHRWWCPNRD